MARLVVKNECQKKHFYNEIVDYKFIIYMNIIVVPIVNSIRKVYYVIITNNIIFILYIFNFCNLILIMKCGYLNKLVPCLQMSLWL